MKSIYKIMLISCLMLLITGCSKETSASSNKKVVIYTSSDENEIKLIRDRLDKKFPEYDIVIEYMSTGSQAAKLKAEETSTECDISYDLEYGYMEMLDKQGVFADLSNYDTAKYVDDLVVSKNYLPTMRYGGAIIINEKVLEEKKLSMPETYEDLLKPEYKKMISMPDPKASGTGYMFLKSLANAWGEEKAIKYFDELSKNVLQFTSSGSGPVNSLIQGEAAIGLGMTSHAAIKISDGDPLKIAFFKEGSPYTTCGAAIIKGKEEKKAVQEVFKYFYEELTSEICEKLYPEQIYKGKEYSIENYPVNIPYADMKNNTEKEKEKLLDLWTH